MPTDCIDIVLNLKSDIVYETDSGKIVAPPFHINGLRSKPSFIRQNGDAFIFGISFHSYGLFPFVRKPLKCLQDEVVDLREMSLELEQKFTSAVSGANSEEIIKSIEHALISELVADPNFLREVPLINDYLTIADDVTVKYFCEQQAINIKTFERKVLFYTGFTPKLLRNIKRFQMASNQLSHQRITNLVEIAYNNNFTDQTHFIKDFRRFSGVAPRAFQMEKISVKENVTYTYF